MWAPEPQTQTHLLDQVANKTDNQTLVPESSTGLPPSSPPPPPPVKKTRKSKVAPIPVRLPPVPAPIVAAPPPPAKALTVSKRSEKPQKAPSVDEAKAALCFSPEGIYFGPDEETFVHEAWGATSTPLPKQVAPALRRRQSVEPVNSERPQKKTRFDDDVQSVRAPSVTSDGTTEINTLLKEAMDVVTKLNTERFLQPNKQLTATRRRLSKRMALTATKWWRESDVLLNNVQNAQQPVAAMYATLKEGATNVFEQSKKRHQKVRFLMQAAPVQLPDTLF